MRRFGGARIKLATGAGGLGQFVVRSAADCDRAFQEVAATGVVDHGACVEVDLVELSAYSANSEWIGALQLSAAGTFRRTGDEPSHKSETRGDSLVVIGDVGALDLAPWESDAEPIKTITSRWHAFMRQVQRHLPYLLVTRQMLQGIIGRDALGQHHVGLTEHGWRRGAATANTLLAAEAMLSDPDLAQVSCSRDTAFTSVVEPNHWVLSSCGPLPWVAWIAARHMAGELVD